MLRWIDLILVYSLYSLFYSQLIERYKKKFDLYLHDELAGRVNILFMLT